MPIIITRRTNSHQSAASHARHQASLPPLNLGVDLSYICWEARICAREDIMLLSWFATAAALLIGDRLLGGVFVGGIGAALIAALVLGLVNAVIKPVMFVMTLPVTIFTLGLFVLVIDAAMLGLVSLVVPHFHIHSLGSGIGLAIIVAITHIVAVSVFGKQKQHS